MRVAIITALLALTATACTAGVSTGTVSDIRSVNTGATATAPPADTPTWGKRYTWPDGLAVEVAAPAPCKPSKSAAVPAGTRAMKFTVTLVNGTGKPVDAVVLGMGVDVQFNGRKADSITDIGGPCGQGFGSGTVLPGKTFTFDMAYGLGPAPGELQMAFQPHLGQDKAVFVGQA